MHQLAIQCTINQSKINASKSNFIRIGPSWECDVTAAKLATRNGSIDADIWEFTLHQMQHLTVNL